MLPSIDNRLRRPLTDVRALPPQLFAPLDAAMQAVERDTERTGGPAGRTALVELFRRNLQAAAEAAEWVPTLQRLTDASAHLMAVWLGIPAARRFRQVGGTCVAICVEYALLRSHACMPLEIIAFLRVPGGLSIFSAVQAAYSAANADLSVLRTCSAEDMLLLRARNIQQAIAKLSQFADRQAQDGETLPARSARQFNVTVCALLTVDLSIRGFCSMSGIVPVAPGVMQPAWQPRDAKGLLRLQRDYIEPADRRWIRILEDALRVAGGGGASVLLVGLEGWANHRAHLIVVDLFSACPGVFDPNLGFIALPEREWISDYLLWLLCLLAVYYRSDHLWVGRVSYSGPMNDTPVRWHAAARRTRTVRRPARK